MLLEYYPGEGLQIQPLGNFGKANAAWSACRSKGDTTCAPLRSLLDAMIALAAERGTFKAWEYYFDFEGGVPPWTSAMSQGTGIQALSRAYALTGATRYRDAAAAALGAFETAPPIGVAVPATGGTHYLMYSYAPKLFIFNGFLQSLVGLDAYRDLTGDARGDDAVPRRQRQRARRSCRCRTPVAGRATRSAGPLSTLEYHVLLRDILGTLCRRQGNPGLLREGSALHAVPGAAAGIACGGTCRRRTSTGSRCRRRSRSATSTSGCCAASRSRSSTPGRRWRRPSRGSRTGSRGTASPSRTSS